MGFARSENSGVECWLSALLEEEFCRHRRVLWSSRGYDRQSCGDGERLCDLRGKNCGQTPICPSKYYGLLASYGQPALGYVQKCAVVLSEGAEVQDLRPLTGSRLLELHGCDSGCAAGMRQITEEEPKQLENKDFLRLRLKLLCKVVRRVWQKNLPEWHGPRESARRPRRRGHWLCNSASGRESILEKRWSARGLSSSR
jgi:hypothetical protein